MRKLRWGAPVLLVGLAAAAHAQDDGAAPAKARLLPKIQVIASDRAGYATGAHYDTKTTELGPLGKQAIHDTPYAVTVVPEDLIVNQQAKTANDILRNLPSVEIRDQQGLEVSRPQSRGFQGSIVQNTRMDGLNIIGTTAVPGENLAGIAVLNGLAGSLFGPETPAGVFNYLLKRPTDQPLLRLIESFDSQHVFTEQVDAGGRFGDDGKIGYRLNLVHGEGEGYVDRSRANRSLFSLALDYHVDERTVVQINLSHYETSANGLPGGIVYGSGGSTRLPRAIDPTRLGLGQPGAGTDLITSTALVKLRHVFANGWQLELGGLYQDALRRLYGITDTFRDNRGNYSVTKNFNAVPRFTVASNQLQLNGDFDLFGLRNDFSVGSNGFDNDQYTNRHSIATPLGSANIDDPRILPRRPVPDSGGRYQSGSLTEQAIIVGDTVHFDERWAVQAVLNDAYIDAKSYDSQGRVSSSDARHGAVSPTLSLIYQPGARLTTYVTYAKSVEQGEAAPTGTVNANQYLAPYHDEQYEAGAKYALADDLLLTMAAFRMSRPLAAADAIGNRFAVVGKQRNNGLEVFLQGSPNAALSLLGGVTYLNARLLNTGVPATNGKWVVGVPHVKSDMSIDFHPAIFDGLALTGGAHFESRRAAINTNQSFAPSYLTLDLGARYTSHLLRHLMTARLQMLNLTDRHYYSSIADGNIVGSAGANTAYYGTPRTLQASVELDL